VGHLLGDDREAIRQDLTTNAAGFFYHRASHCYYCPTIAAGAGDWKFDICFV
jgi:hypothetical protein